MDVSLWLGGFAALKLRFEGRLHGLYRMGGAVEYLDLPCIDECAGCFLRYMFTAKSHFKQLKHIVCTKWKQDFSSINKHLIGMAAMLAAIV